MAFENVNLFYAKNKYGEIIKIYNLSEEDRNCLLYTSPSPRDA